MPEDLLLELENAAPLAGNFDNMEVLEREALRHGAQVELAVQALRSTSISFQNIWQRLVTAIALGQTAEVHAARPRLLDAFNKRFDHLKQTHALATWLMKLGSEHITGPDVLLAVISDLDRLKNLVFDRWQTGEDLEDLAARDYPLTTADLDRLGPQQRPAAAYYAEEASRSDFAKRA